MLSTKNLNFIFNDEEYKAFSEYIGKLDGKYWEYSNSRSFLQRKIVISVKHKNLRMLLNNAELKEFKTLLLPDKYEYKLNVNADFNYNFCNN